MGIEEHVAVRCPCCDAVDVDIRHVHICLCRPGAQLNQPHNRLSTRCPVPGTSKQLGIGHQVENGEPFTADRNLRVDIAVRRGGLRDAPSREYREKPILLGATHADPQAQIQLPLPPRRASANTALVRDICPLTTGVTNLPLSSGKLWASRGRGH